MTDKILIRLDDLNWEFDVAGKNPVFFLSKYQFRREKAINAAKASVGGAQSPEILFVDENGIIERCEQTGSAPCKSLRDGGYKKIVEKYLSQLTGSKYMDILHNVEDGLLLLKTTGDAVSLLELPLCEMSLLRWAIRLSNIESLHPSLILLLPEMVWDLSDSSKARVWQCVVELLKSATQFVVIGGIEHILQFPFSECPTSVVYDLDQEGSAA